MIELRNVAPSTLFWKRLYRIGADIILVLYMVEFLYIYLVQPSRCGELSCQIYRHRVVCSILLVSVPCRYVCVCSVTQLCPALATP